MHDVANIIVSGIDEAEVKVPPVRNAVPAIFADPSAAAWPKFAPGKS